MKCDVCDRLNGHRPFCSTVPKPFYMPISGTKSYTLSSYGPTPPPKKVTNVQTPSASLVKYLAEFEEPSEIAAEIERQHKMFFPQTYNVKIHEFEDDETFRKRVIYVCGKTQRVMNSLGEELDVIAAEYDLKRRIL